MSSGVTDRVADMAFRSRALAQAHPLTEEALAYRREVVEVEQATQPLPEFAEWAGTAFLVGYCVRRVEEADAGTELPSEPADQADPERFAARASTIAEGLRAGRADITLLEAGVVEAVLDRVIASEIDKRADWREHVTDEDWDLFEQYVTWWVVHGYAWRTAEIEARR